MTSLTSGNVLIPGLVSFEEGYALLQMLKRHLPGLAPTLCGNHKPLKTVFADRAAVEAVWRWPFIWKGGKPHVSGFVSLKIPASRHSEFQFSAPGKFVDFDAALVFLGSVAHAFAPDFMYIHPFSEADRARAYATNTLTTVSKGKLYCVDVASATLMQYVPDLYWATVFGPAYVQHFGKQRLLSSPACKVEEIGPDQVLLQLTPDPLAIHYKDLEEVRSRVKKHLGMESFYGERWGSSHRYRVPPFG